MKVSEVIEELENIMFLYGDIDVLVPKFPNANTEGRSCDVVDAINIELCNYRNSEEPDAIIISQ